MRVLFTCLILFISFFGSAQVVISVNPTGRDAEAISKGKLIAKQLKAQKRKAKHKKDQVDTLESSREERKELAKKKKNELVRKRPTDEEDSLRSVLNHLALLGDFQAIESIHEAYRCTEDSTDESGRLAKLALSYLPPEQSSDSLSWALHALSAEKQYEELNAVRGLLQSPDSISNYEQLAQNLIPIEKLESDADLPDLPESEFPEIPKEAFPHADMDELTDKIPPTTLNSSLNKVSKLKKKYTTLPDIRYPKAGTKKSSLKNQGLASRFTLGGNLSLTSTDPVAIDINLQLGYRFNRNFTIGSGIQWKRTFSDDSLISNKRRGYNVFSRYVIYSGIYAYGEFASTNQSLSNGLESSAWQNQYLLGVGRETKLYKNLYLTTTLLYNFNHKHNGIHTNPLSFRIGINVNGLNGVRKNKK